MLYLVTGGAGFIGSHIVEYLLSQEHRVRVLDNFSSGSRKKLKGLPNQHHLEVIEGDIREIEIVKKSVRGVDGIFHQAALVSVPLSVKEPLASFQNNIQGSFNVFEAARQENVRRIVYASSAAVYGKNSNLPLKETEPYAPLNPYALDKVYQEQLAQVYWRRYGLVSVGLRYFNVYGTRQNPHSPYSGVISIFVERLAHNQNVIIYGEGKQSRDFINIKDVVFANILSMNATTDRGGAEIFNVGTGIATSINQLLVMLQQLLKNQSTQQYALAREGDILHSLADNTKIKSTLNWQSEIKLKFGLHSLIAQI